MRTREYFLSILLVVLLPVHGLCNPPGYDVTAFNFEDADIKAVAKAVGLVTGKTFVFDTAVQGHVTILTNDVSDPSKLYPLFVSVLEVNGYSVIEYPDFVKIVPTNKAALLGGHVTFQIKLEHADARRIGRILRGIVSDSNESDIKGDTPQARIVDDVYSNSLIIDCPRTDQPRLRDLVHSLDEPLEMLSGTTVIKLDFAPAGDLLPVLMDLDGDKKVTVDRGSNSLIITAASEVLESVFAVIADLDVRRPQVMIEAIIAEVSDDQAEELGVQWQAGQDDVFFSSAFSATGQAINRSSKPNIFPDGLTFGFLGPNLASLVRALHSDSDSNLLSTPRLLTLDNETATISVGQNVPFVTGSYQGAGSEDTSKPFQTIERHDVGVKLTVTPQINSGDTIRLDIQQEVSGIASSTETGNLITNRRTIKTKVLVDSGKTLVLGGLRSKDIIKSEQRVPLLGYIPILGHAFRYQKEISTNRNLLVFIKPTVIRDAAASAALTSDFKEDSDDNL